MKMIIARTGVLCMKIIYGIMKLFPAKKNRVLFLSRQSEILSLDFKLLHEELLKQNAKIKVKSICCYLSDYKNAKLVRFAWALLRSMYYLSVSGVCVLDSYWPAVSVLRHKKSLTVIQMWHAMGKIKQSGYQTLDKPGGRNAAVAHIMAMHKNYDIIVAGGPAWNEYYCKSFGTTEDKLLNIGLPRLDYLIANKEVNKEKILEKYPEFINKEILLYAPTFRRGDEKNITWKELPALIDHEKQALLLKGHPLQNLEWSGEGVYDCPEFSAVELLSVADYLITDYSAIAVEAAAVDVKTYYYLYDYSDYIEKNGLNVSPYDTMPGCAFQNAADIINNIRNKEYPAEELAAYKEKYLPAVIGHSTQILAETIIDTLKTQR